MTTRTKLYSLLAISAIFAIGLIGSYAWSSRKITMLEATVANAKAAALEKQQTDEAREIEAAKYSEKVLYLESNLAEIKQLSRKQDEQLQKLTTNSRNARISVERVRNTRAIAATAAELCAKLAEVGHPCD